MDYNPSLETKRLILRKISEADKMDLFELLTNSQIDKKMVWNHLDDMNEITEYLNEIIDSYHIDQPSCFGIELKESGKLIGIIKLFNYEDESGLIMAGLQYFIFQEPTPGFIIHLMMGRPGIIANPE